MLIWIGAMVSGYLGYRLLDWWLPAVVAVAVVALQAVSFRTMLSGSGAGGYEILVFSLAINLLMFHATFAIGRSIRQRLDRRRRKPR